MSAPHQGSAIGFRWVVSGIGWLLVTISSNAAKAADAAAVNDPALQEVVVTGSLIPRDPESAPILLRVIDAQDVKASGNTDLSSVLRNLPANGSGTLSQAFPGFAGGASGISLRGLSVGDTLTLIDGHRMVPYPLYDDVQRSFVDLSSIPLAALDHVEVLEDGASAEYGSDAIAGVVNVVLRKTYIGAEIDGEAGTSTKHDGTLEHVTGIAGTGDLDSDGFNLYGALEFQHQNPIPLANRHGLYTNRDWAPFGGVDRVPGSAPTASIPFPTSNTGYLIDPNTSSGMPLAFFPGCDVARQAASQCSFQHPVELQPPSRNLNVIGRASLALPSGGTLAVTASLFNSAARQLDGSLNAPYPRGFDIVALEPGGVPFVVGPQVITVPANYPGNPFGAPAPLVYTFDELGPYEALYETNTYRLAVDLRGSAAGWNLATSIELQYARTNERLLNDIDPALLQSALNDGYRVGRQARGGGAALFAPPAEGSSSSQLNVFSVNADRKLLTLPGGPLSLGAGAEFDQHVANVQAVPSVAAGQQLGTSAYVIGSQDDIAAFAELSGKVMRSLEVSAAVRYDHYNTYGSSLTPRFGVRFAPLKVLSLEGSWGRGFRAPNPAEAQKSAIAFDNGAIADPQLCPHRSDPTALGNFPSQCSIRIPSLLEANPKLEPERSTNFSAGFKLQPAAHLQLSADYYRIALNNSIIPSYAAGGFDNSNVTTAAPVRGAPVSLPLVNADGSITSRTTPVGLILYQPYQYINVTSTTTSGVDVRLESALSTENAGTFDAKLEYTHLIAYSIEAYGLVYELAGTHGPSEVSGDTGNPRDRAQLTLSWTRNAATLTSTINYVGSFDLTDPSGGLNTCSDAVAAQGDFAPGSAIPAKFCTVDHFVDVDLYGSYRLGRHCMVHLSVLNLLNRQPPVDLATYGGGGGAAYDAGFHQAGAVGRFFTFGVTATL